jgi:hypothetical protein
MNISGIFRWRTLSQLPCHSKLLSVLLGQLTLANNIYNSCKVCLVPETWTLRLVLHTA